MRHPSQFKIDRPSRRSHPGPRNEWRSAKAAHCQHGAELRAGNTSDTANPHRPDRQSTASKALQGEQTNPPACKADARKRSSRPTGRSRCVQCHKEGGKDRDRVVRLSNSEAVVAGRAHISARRSPCATYAPMACKLSLPCSCLADSNTLYTARGPAAASPRNELTVPPDPAQVHRAFGDPERLGVSNPCERLALSRRVPRSLRDLRPHPKRSAREIRGNAPGTSAKGECSETNQRSGIGRRLTRRPNPMSANALRSARINACRIPRARQNLPFFYRFFLQNL